jgi:hypothetical protein
VCWLLLVLAVVAATLTAASGARPASSGGEVPQARKPTLPGPVGYDVSVTFWLRYYVEWRAYTGHEDPADPCVSWRDDAGTATVVAHNEGANEKPRLKPLQGHFAPSLASILPPGVPIPPGTKLPKSWAELDALGTAKGSFYRLWIQHRGGPPSTPCRGMPVVPYQRYDDDCGQREFTLGRRAPATIRAEQRSAAMLDLAGVTTPVFAPGARTTPVLSVSVPAVPPFRKCRIRTGMPEELIASIGLPVSETDIRALRTLPLNRTRTVRAKLRGDCALLNGSDDSCSFDIRGWVAIKHIQRNPYQR